MRKAVIQDLLFYIKVWDSEDEAFSMLIKQLSNVRLDSKSTAPIQPLDYSNSKSFQDIFQVTATHISEMMFKDIHPRYLKSLSDGNNTSNAKLSSTSLFNFK